MKYLIDFYNTATDNDIQSYLDNNNCVVIKEWDNYEKTFLVEAATTPPGSDLVDRIVEEVPLKIKPLDYHPHHVNGDVNPYCLTHNDPSKPKIEIDTMADKDWWKNYSFLTPKFSEESYTISRLGQNLNVYLMDSGIEASHPEFSDANIVNLYTVTPNNYADNKGHGTALASLIVGKTCGITGATVKNVKIYDNNHQTLQSEFLDALDAIINDHVVGNHAVVNCSWVIEKNEWVEHKLRILFSRGVSILAAAGNQGVSIEDVTPASMPEALTVGAYNKDLLPCDFSNYTGTSVISVTGSASNHGELDGWAPGEQIYVAGLNGTYGYASGTSLSAAICSAILISNLSWFVDDNGVPYPYYADKVFASIDPVGSAVFLFAKYNLLDLSPDKYSESKNVIAAIIDRAQFSYNRQQPDHVYARVVANNSDQYKIISNLYNPVVTKKIEWVNPLADNFILLPDGKLITKPNTLPAPENNQYYYIHSTGTFNRTNLDDSVDLVTVDIYVLQENVSADNLPENDPLINIVLSFDACTGVGGGCSPDAPNVQFCNDFCEGNSICCNNCDIPKVAYHFCVCGTCN
jgi:subtilisin family serine protease